MSTALAGSTTDADPVRTLTPALRPVRGRLATAAALGAAATLCAIGLMATSGWLISRASEQPPVLTLEIAIVCVRAFGIGRGFLRYAERLVSHDAVFRSLTAVHVRIWGKLERLAPHGIPAFRRGDLLARMVADVDAVQDLALRVWLPVTTAVVAGSVSVAVTWWLLPFAGMVLLVALVAGGLVVPWVTVMTGRRAQAVTAQARGELSADVREAFRGATDLIAAGVQGAAIERIRTTDAELTRLSRRLSGSTGFASALGVVIAGLAVLGALVVALPAVADGRLSGVSLAVVVLLPLAAYEAVVGLPQAALALIGVRASGARLAAILDAPDPVQEPACPQALSVGRALSEGIRLEQLSVRWQQGGPDVVRGLDLDLSPGSRVALVGPSGSGKSTVVAALMRFVEYSGSVRVGGQELRELAADEVRSVIGLCEQSAHVFDSTILENLLLARPDATRSDAATVLGRVRLADWVAGLPDGVDTWVGEHGSRLSGGQRQRLALARVLLADPMITVLDEPTEHLDEATASLLTEDLLSATRGRTTLLVTHRLQGLEDLDEIVVLDLARVIERGTHDELMRQRGWYAAARGREEERAVVGAFEGWSQD